MTYGRFTIQNLMGWLGLSVFLTLPAFPALALENDREQPAVIDADEVDIDFQTGTRIYRGNVFGQQGTIRIDADEVQLYYNDEDLEKVIAFGKPVVFRQRPDGKEHDVIGRGLKVEIDQIQNIVTLTDKASLTQNKDTVTGQVIVYNMATDKLMVRGGGAAPTRTTVVPEGSTAPVPDAPEPVVDENAPLIDTTGTRPRIVLDPPSPPAAEAVAEKAEAVAAEAEAASEGADAAAPATEDQPATN